MPITRDGLKIRLTYQPESVSHHSTSLDMNTKVMIYKQQLFTITKLYRQKTYSCNR